MKQITSNHCCKHYLILFKYDLLQKCIKPEHILYSLFNLK